MSETLEQLLDRLPQSGKWMLWATDNKEQDKAYCCRWTERFGRKTTEIVCYGANPNIAVEFVLIELGRNT